MHETHVSHTFAIVQDGLKAVCFNGRRLHGGSPPTAPVGQKPKPWSYRLVFVAYPSNAMLNGESLISYGAMPQDQLFSLTPEMIHSS